VAVLRAASALSHLFPYTVGVNNFEQNLFLWHSPSPFWRYRDFVYHEPANNALCTCCESRSTYSSATATSYRDWMSSIASETQRRGTYVLVQIKLLVVPNRHQRQPSTNSPTPHSRPIKHALPSRSIPLPDSIEHMSVGLLMLVHSLPCNAGGFCWNDNNDHDLPKCSMLARATCR